MVGIGDVVVAVLVVVVFIVVVVVDVGDVNVTGSYKTMSPVTLQLPRDKSSPGRRTVA